MLTNLANICIPFLPFSLLFSYNCHVHDSINRAVCNCCSYLTVAFPEATALEVSFIGSMQSGLINLLGLVLPIIIQLIGYRGTMIIGGVSTQPISIGQAYILTIATFVICVRSWVVLGSGSTRINLRQFHYRAMAVVSHTRYDVWNRRCASLSACHDDSSPVFASKPISSCRHIDLRFRYWRPSFESGTEYCCGFKSFASNGV